MGLILLLRKFSIKSMLAHCVSELFWKLGEFFETSSYHIRNFDRLLKSKIRYAHGIHYLKSWIILYKVSLAHPS